MPHSVKFWSYGKRYIPSLTDLYSIFYDIVFYWPMPNGNLIIFYSSAKTLSNEKNRNQNETKTILLTSGRPHWLSGFICAFQGSNPKNSIYAFSIYCLLHYTCHCFEKRTKVNKKGRSRGLAMAQWSTRSSFECEVDSLHSVPHRHRKHAFWYLETRNKFDPCNLIYFFCKNINNVLKLADSKLLSYAAIIE